MSVASVSARWAAGAPPGCDLDGVARIDPYLVWAQLSGWAEYRRSGPEVPIPVIFEIPDEAEACGRAGGEHAAFIASVRGRNPLNDLTLRPGAPASSRISTGAVEQRELARMQQAVRDGALARFKLGLARGVPVEAGEPAGPAGVASADLAARCGRQDDKLETLGVIDDGCCLAHEAFRQGRTSAFLYVWDQDPESGIEPPWQRLAALPYGAELDAAALDGLLARFPDLGEDEERALYRSIERPHWGNEDRTHGAGVLHVLSDTRFRATGSGHRPAATPAGPLIFVQLPGETVADTSGGSLGAYVVDGARYIVQRSCDAAAAAGREFGGATINISLGSIAGPHDGTSMTERALANLAAVPGVNVVLAAGNTSGKAIHAVRRVSASAPGRFDVLVPNDNPRESFVEIWLPPASGADTPCPGTDTPGTGTDTPDPDAFTVEVVAPTGERSPVVGAGEAATWTTAGGVRASVIFARRVAQGLDGTMVLVAIRSTRPAAGDADEDLGGGFWSIEVATAAAGAAEVHAWVERNDVIIGRRQPQAAAFVDDRSGYIRDDYTLSSIASGAGVHVVGAYRVADRTVARYSGEGPARSAAPRQGVDCCAPSDESLAIAGLPVPGFFSGQWRRMSGTSVAAPHLARAIATGALEDGSARIIEVAPNPDAAAPDAPAGTRKGLEFRRRS